MGLRPIMNDAEVYEQLAAALYGDGAWEISKARGGAGGTALSDTERKNREKTQAKIGLASNVVGLAAGIGGTAAALRDDRFQQGGRLSRKIFRTGKKIPQPISGKTGRVGAALAGGALGLQVANIAGDAVANRVLARSAKPEKKKVSKKQAEIQPSQVKGKLVKVSVNSGFEAAKQLPKVKEKTNSFTAKGTISKSVEDKRQVFGWASIVELNGEPVVDLQGDYMAIDVIEKAAYDYVNRSRKGSDMHKGHHASDLIESFIVTDEKKKILNLPDSTPTGWWVGFKVNDDDLWQMVKDGKRPEFSIHGSGQRVDVEI